VFLPSSSRRGFLKNRIDHQLYDHASIPATLQQLFGIPALTNRDAAAHDVTPLLSLPALRTDTPITLPNPAFPVAPPIAQRALPPENSVNTRSLPGFLNLAMRRDMAMSDPAAQPTIVARVRAIQTRGEAAAVHPTSASQDAGCRSIIGIGA